MKNAGSCRSAQRISFSLRVLTLKPKLLQKAFVAERKRRKELQRDLSILEEAIQQERKEIYERVKV